MIEPKIDDLLAAVDSKYSLVILAAGAVLAGFLGVPAALGGHNVFHHWLEPVFAGHVGGHDIGVGMATAGAATVAASTEGHNTDLEMILMGVSVLVAMPLGYYVVQWWLEGFAYKVQLGVVVFAGAGVLALVIAWLTVGLESWKAARMNPVNALRTE